MTLEASVNENRTWEYSENLWIAVPVEVYEVLGQATELLVLHIWYCSENGRLSEVPTRGATVPAMFAVHTMTEPFGRNEGVHDPEEFTVPVDPMPVVVTVNPFVGTLM